MNARESKAGLVILHGAPILAAAAIYLLVKHAPWPNEVLAAAALALACATLVVTIGGLAASALKSRSAALLLHVNGAAFAMVLEWGGFMAMVVRKWPEAALVAVFASVPAVFNIIRARHARRST